MVWLVSRLIFYAYEIGTIYFEDLMSLQKEKVASIVKEYGKSASDTGSTEVQVALLTERVNALTDHLKTNVKDSHSLVGLMKMVGQRKRLLRYLQNSNPTSYKNVINKLGIRR